MENKYPHIEFYVVYDNNSMMSYVKRDKLGTLYACNTSRTKDDTLWFDNENQRWALSFYNHKFISNNTNFNKVDTFDNGIISIEEALLDSKDSEKSIMCKYHKWIEIASTEQKRPETTHCDSEMI